MTPRTIRLIALLLISAGRISAAQTAASGQARPAEGDHVDAVFHGHGVDPTGGIHVGTPGIASVSLGPKLYLGDHFSGALYATVEPSLFAFRAGAGYQVFDPRLYGVGAGARYVVLEGWLNGLGMERGVRYSGPEVVFTGPFAFGFRFGQYTGSRRDGTRLNLWTFDLGFGF